MSRWLALLLVLAWQAPAAAERRVALVIGNAAYAQQPELRNPLHDATAMAALLHDQLGFEVAPPVRNGRLSDMAAALSRFAEAARGADVALFFYAGHGMELDGQNRLLPVDANLDTELNAQLQTLPLELVLNAMKAARLKVVLLDACRNDPRAARMTRMSGARAAIGGGLAEVRDLPEGTVLAFAAAPGRTAGDGDGANSPFTTALLQHLAQPEEILNVLRDTATTVRQATGSQRPWVNFNMEGRLYLRGAPQPMPPAAPRPAPAQVSAPAPAQLPRLSPAPRGTAPAQDCDRLAQPPRGLMGRAPNFAEGVALERLDGAAAVAACERALRSWPDETRFTVYLARALFRLGQYQRAELLFRQAVTQGNAMAEAGLGYMLEQGQGVPRNEAEAVRLYRLSAAQGFPVGQLNLANMLASGRGVAKDEAEAARLLRLAAEQGVPVAINNLASMYWSGRGVPRDEAQAVRLYRQAAAQGDVTALANLGYAAEHGRGGLAANRGEAVRLYRQAARGGHPEAAAALRRLGEREPW